MVPYGSIALSNIQIEGDNLLDKCEAATTDNSPTTFVKILILTIYQGEYVKW